MAKANGSSVEFNAGIESTPGVSPSAMQTLKCITSSGDSLNSSATELTSATITKIRDISGLRNGIYSVSGSLAIELASEGTGIFLHALMGSKVTTGSGPYIHTYHRTSNVPSLTIERVYSNMSPLQTQVYNGCKVNQMSFTFEPGSLVTSSVDLIGRKSIKGTAVIDATPDSYDHVPFAGIDASTIEINGVTTTVVKGSLTISNGVEATNVLGSQFADDVIEGKGEVSGSFDLYFEDRVHYDMFVSETVFPISLTLTRGSNSIVFNIPNAKFSGNRDVVVSTDKALIATYTFKAIQDSSINGAIEIVETNSIA